MTMDKRRDTESFFADDREADPKIGRSKGAFATGEDPELIDGENTVEGDVENDSTYAAAPSRASSGAPTNSSVDQVRLPLCFPVALVGCS